MAKILRKQCESCGKPIPKTRLSVLPDTTLCVVCSDKIGPEEPKILHTDDSYNAEDCRDILSGDH